MLFRSVKQWQELFQNKRYSSVHFDISPDFLKLAEANFIKGYRIDKLNELERLNDLLKSDEPMLIDIVISDEYNVYPIIPAGKSIEHMIGGEHFDV